MQIQELDPTKQYAVILSEEYATQEDMENVSQRLKALGINGVVLAGAELRGGDSYWGVYCPQHGVWQRKTDGTLYFYPAKAIAQAHADTERDAVDWPVHLWEAQEYGKEVKVNREDLDPRAAVCVV